jgi:hypothetical protein
LKPRLEIHEIRLRGLGGHTVCGVPGTGASATGAWRNAPRERHQVIGRTSRACHFEGAPRCTCGCVKTRCATEKSSVGMLVAGRRGPGLAATIGEGGLRIFQRRIIPFANLIQ